MVDDDNTAQMTQALQGAFSIELYQMRSLIDGMTGCWRTPTTRAA